MGNPISYPNRPQGRFLPNPKLKFLEQCGAVMRFKHLARRTEETYLQWIRRYILFHRRPAVAQHPSRGAVAPRSPQEMVTPRLPSPGLRPSSPTPVGEESAPAGEGKWIWRHPREMGEVEVRMFLTDLAVRRGVSAATQNQALNALLFLYREVVGGEMAWVDGFEQARRSQRIPVVLTREEAQNLLKGLSGTQGLIGRMLYGTGMRLLVA